MLRAETQAVKEEEPDEVSEVDLTPLSIAPPTPKLEPEPPITPLTIHTNLANLPGTPNSAKSKILDDRRLHDLQDENEMLKLQLHKVVAQLANTEFTFAEKLDRMNLTHLMEVERLQTETQADAAEMRTVINSLKEELERTKEELKRQHDINLLNGSGDVDIILQPSSPNSPSLSPNQPNKDSPGTLTNSIITATNGSSPLRDWELKKLQMANERERDRLSLELNAAMKRQMQLQTEVGMVEDQLMLISGKYQDAVETIDVLTRENEDLKQQLASQPDISLHDDDSDDDIHHIHVHDDDVLSHNNNNHINSIVNKKKSLASLNKSPHINLLDLDDLGL
ncbi:hypothetical protein SmJEL517_g03344 [Synchytrium microbalum]|uniref:Uncharacterized protein n=1 Tax=Synchytrium microbalum TaxID=1806994 RepID=A0A507C306_9FUNG|nr:uncharacterized protein SmJEL517_g03344 [Synchytrium microbalum]TPX33821.1 hypothetical protein SmJEL517_g03344 [Synchytrium microbalum]